jgi:hypothetical protein
MPSGTTSTRRSTTTAGGPHRKSTNSSTTTTVTDVIQTVVKAVASDLADLAVKAPVNAEAALKQVVSDVSAVASTADDKTAYLQAVVTATVQVSVKKGQTDLAEAVFAGAAVATSDVAVIQKVVEQAVTKATATQASTATLSEQDKTDISNVITEALPSAGLSATDSLGTASGVAVPATAVDYPATTSTVTGYTVTLTATVSGGTGETGKLSGPDGIDIPLSSNVATYTTSEAGAFRFVLTVTSASGEKRARATVLLIVNQKADEAAPTAVLTFKEGSTDSVTLLIADNPDLKILDNGDGTWSTTVADEPTPVAKMARR